MIHVLASVGMALACQDVPKLQEGVYSLCEEVAGYSGETVELKDGKFRYWFYTDVVIEGREEPKYPLSGTYSLKADRVILDHPQIHRKERTIAKVNGVDVLWREDGLDLWKKEKRIHAYAVLLRVAGVTDGSKVATRPSLESLMTKEMKDRDKKEYEERFNDQPAEVRVLLRARSRNDDPDLDAYTKEIGKARVQPEPKLLSQLVALMHTGSPAAINAGRILEDLFLETWLIKEAPPFLKEGDSKRKALEALIDALSSARDRNALEDTLLLFLRVSGTGMIDLAIDGTGVQVSLESRPEGTKCYRSHGPGDDVNWLKVISKVTPACQKWMRSQLAK